MTTWHRVPIEDLHTEPPKGSPDRPPTYSHRRAFANKVIERIATAGRVAVIDAFGKPALVECREKMYDILARDHEIVGVYGYGARATDVVEDLQAAGL